MKKITSLKISLFTFLSTIICIIGNNILQLNILFYICQGLGFLSYLFFLIWLAQIIYEKVKFAINLIVLFMSFGLAAYSLALFSFIPYEKIFEYYVLFFYFFSLTCLLSSIILIGRIIFHSPKSEENTIFDKEENTVDVSVWTCTCGIENKGKFCSECGLPMPVIEVNEKSLIDN